MKTNDGTSIFHRQLLGRILAEAMLHPETQGCDCILCKKREQKVEEEKVRLGWDGFPVGSPPALDPEKSKSRPAIIPSSYLA